MYMVVCVCIDRYSDILSYMYRSIAQGYSHHTDRATETKKGNRAPTKIANERAKRNGSAVGDEKLWHSFFR